MKKKLLLLSLFFATVACAGDSLNTKKYRTVYFYTYGLQSYWNDDKNCVARCQKQFGFDHKVKAGCIIRPLKLLRLQAHNNRVENKLSKRFGPDWREQYEKMLKECDA